MGGFLFALDVLLSVAGLAWIVGGLAGLAVVLWVFYSAFWSPEVRETERLLSHRHKEV